MRMGGSARAVWACRSRLQRACARRHALLLLTLPRRGTWGGQAAQLGRPLHSSGSALCLQLRLDLLLLVKDAAYVARALLVA
jgi:hypothetical protein